MATLTLNINTSDKFEPYEVLPESEFLPFAIKTCEKFKEEGKDLTINVRYEVSLMSFKVCILRELISYKDVKVVYHRPEWVVPFECVFDEGAYTSDWPVITEDPFTSIDSLLSELARFN